MSNVTDVVMGSGVPFYPLGMRLLRSFWNGALYNTAYTIFSASLKSLYEMNSHHLREELRGRKIVWNGMVSGGVAQTANDQTIEILTEFTGGHPLYGALVAGVAAGVNAGVKKAMTHMEGEDG